MSIFSKQNDSELLAKIAEIQASLREQSEAMQAIYERIEALSTDVNSIREALNDSLRAQDAVHAHSQSTDSASSTHADEPKTGEFFLSAPRPDGIFRQFSNEEQMGKSVYRLTTYDGRNGTFAVLTSKDATATALLSVSQILKPACRIASGGRTSATIPQSITTVKEGRATFDGTAWKVVEKAVIAM